MSSGLLETLLKLGYYTIKIAFHFLAGSSMSLLLLLLLLYILVSIELLLLYTTALYCKHSCDSIQQNHFCSHLQMFIMLGVFIPMKVQNPIVHTSGTYSTDLAICRLKNLGDNEVGLDSRQIFFQSWLIQGLEALKLG